MSEENEKKTINGLFSKQLVSARLSTETIELIDENFQELTGGTQPVTDRKLIECLLDGALAKGKPNAELQKKCEALSKQVEDHLKTIEHLKDANINLEGEVEQSKQESGEIQDLKNKIFKELQETTNELTEYKEKLQKATLDLEAALKNKTPEGAILIQLTDKEIKVLQTIAQEETARTKKPVTIDLLMKNVFFYILVNGPHDVFSAPVSIKRIREILAPQQSPTPNS